MIEKNNLMVLRTAGDVADERNKVFSQDIKKWMTKFLEDKLLIESHRVDKELRKVLLEAKDFFNVPELIGPSKFNEPDNLYPDYATFVRGVTKQIKQTGLDLITVESNLDKKGEKLTEEVNKAHVGLANFKHASYREIHSIKGDLFDKISETNKEIEAFRKIYD